MTADPGKEMGFARNAGNEERVVDVVSADCDAAGRRSLTSGAAGSVTRGLSRRWMRRATRYESRSTTRSSDVGKSSRLCATSLNICFLLTFTAIARRLLPPPSRSPSWLTRGLPAPSPFYGALAAPRQSPSPRHPRRRRDHPHPGRRRHPNPPSSLPRPRWSPSPTLRPPRRRSRPGGPISPPRSR